MDPLLGKNIKCPSCKSVYKVSPSASPQINPAGFPVVAAPVVYTRPPRKTRPWFLPLKYDPTAAASSDRYPNLLRYIKIVEVLQKIFFWIAIAGGILYAIFGVWMALNTLLRGDFLYAIGILIFSVIGGP